MKVQVPSEEVIEANRLLTIDVDPTTIPKKPYHKGFRDAIDYCNEQLASPLPTKRPFLSDDEIEDEVKDFDYAEDRELYRNAARWARDKYEARDGSDVATVEPDQTFYVIKRDDEPAYLGWDHRMEDYEWFPDITDTFLFGNPDEARSVRRRHEAMGYKTARIVKVRVSEVGE